ARIVAFVRSLITAARRLEADPEAGCLLVANTAKLDIKTVRGSWPRFDYPGTLAADLLERLARQEPWLAKVERRSPRSRDALGRLIDDSVLREAGSSRAA
ncbi:MAG TPA: hypothetical protein VIA19_05190, partial [Burkholderiales bacterium]